jgi:hypothetical protein
VISGAFGISYEQTEELKKDPTQQERLFPASARKRSQIASMQVITNVSPYESQLLNRFTRGMMLVASQTMLVLECTPAAYINLAANEARERPRALGRHRRRIAISIWPRAGTFSWSQTNSTFVRRHTTSPVGIDPQVDRESYPSHYYRDAEGSSGCVTHEGGSEPAPRKAAEGKWRDQKPVDGTEKNERYRCHGIGESEDHVLDGVTTRKSLPCRGEKQGEHEDASRRAEVTAIDGHKEHTHSESDRFTPRVDPLDFLRSLLHEDRNRGERDEPRHNELEGAGRRDQQQQPADDATKNRYEAEPN